MNSSDIAAEILTAVRDRFGISFSETMTGGGCMALHARLETGHWIVAVDEGLTGFRRRIDLETERDDDGARRYPAGWSLGIYPDAGGDDEWFGEDSIADATDYDAYAEDLPEMVARVLSVFIAGRGVSNSDRAVSLTETDMSDHETF